MLPIVLIFCLLEFVLKILLLGEEVEISLNARNRPTLGFDWIQSDCHCGIFLRNFSCISVIIFLILTCNVHYGYWKCERSYLGFRLRKVGELYFYICSVPAMVCNSSNPCGISVSADCQNVNRGRSGIPIFISGWLCWSTKDFFFLLVECYIFFC